jgi:hypothetical protein
MTKKIIINPFYTGAIDVYCTGSIPNSAQLTNIVENERSTSTDVIGVNR